MIPVRETTDIVSEGAGEAGRGALPFWLAGLLAVSPPEVAKGAAPAHEAIHIGSEEVTPRECDEFVRALNCEDTAMRARTKPSGPTSQQRGGHDADGHILDHAWCRACVAGRCRDDRHETHLGVAGSVDVLALDCARLGGGVPEGESEGAFAMRPA